MSDRVGAGRAADGAPPPLPAELREALERIVGADGVITDSGSLLVYECDGLAIHRAPPRAVVLPRSTAETAAVLRQLARHGLCFVARGAGTGLSGGALALDGAVMVSLTRMKRILALDPENRRARVEAGVVNTALMKAVAPYGLTYAPDPGSQTACTLGGNVAENAGGMHCLKYGVTLNHVTGLTVVLADGDVVHLGAGAGEPLGYDLLGLFIGSEGTFGIATEVEVKLTAIPDAAETLLALFDRMEDAGRAVSAIIAAGLLPAALEIIDQEGIRAVEASQYRAGWPTDVGAALVVEFDGVRAGLGEDADRAREICGREGAREVKRAADDAERTRFWHARKKAFGAMGRLAPDVLVQDATVPRSRLPEVLRQIMAIAARDGLKVVNYFHAGDGNLHPNILYDRRDPEQLVKVEKASKEIMRLCVAAGGSITGEHGVGVDKLPYMPLIFGDAELVAMWGVRLVFDPELRANPGKVLPEVLSDGRRAAVAAAPRASEDGSGDAACPVLAFVGDVAGVDDAAEPGDPGARDFDRTGYAADPAVPGAGDRPGQVGP